jgi:hypothetical protein
VRVSLPQLVETAGEVRVEATVTWESTDRPPLTIWFATDPDFAEHLDPGPEAFLAATLTPAMHHGEVRLAVDGAVCPVLLEGAHDAADWLATWYPGAAPPSIEADVARSSDPPAPCAAMFLSGGVDSLSLLRRNTSDVAPTHPVRVTTCFLIHGFAIDRDGRQRESDEAARDRLARLDRVSRTVGASTIPVRTNVRRLDADRTFWIDQFHGAALSSVAHAIGARHGTVHIASGDIDRSRPHGSHPFIDPMWSSYRRRLHHDTMRFSRLEKTAQVADWPDALEVLNVCTQHTAGATNCGRCEKCVRTKLMLLAVGTDLPWPFVHQGLAADDVRHVPPFVINQYADLAPRLTRLGRSDLAHAITRAMRHTRVEQALGDRRAGIYRRTRLRARRLTDRAATARRTAR